MKSVSAKAEPISQDKKSKTSPNIVLPMPVVTDTWKAAKNFTLAIITAAFPVLFILDMAIDFAVSPVLPTLATFIVLFSILPIVFIEIAQRNLRRAGPVKGPLRARLWWNISRLTLVASAIWLVGWITMGA